MYQHLVGIRHPGPHTVILFDTAYKSSNKPIGSEINNYYGIYVQNNPALDTKCNNGDNWFCILVTSA